MIVGGKINIFFYSYIICYIFFFTKYIFVLINRLFLMDLDKSWIDLPQNTQQYMDGLNKFLDFAFANKSVEGKIICPCPKCNLNKWQNRGATYEHLILHPFPKGIHFGFYMVRQIMYNIQFQHLQFSNRMRIEDLLMIPYVTWLMMHSEIL